MILYANSAKEENYGLNEIQQSIEAVVALLDYRSDLSPSEYLDLCDCVLSINEKLCSQQGFGEKQKLDILSPVLSRMNLDYRGRGVNNDISTLLDIYVSYQMEKAAAGWAEAAMFMALHDTQSELIEKEREGVEKQIFLSMEQVIRLEQAKASIEVQTAEIEEYRDECNAYQNGDGKVNHKGIVDLITHDGQRLTCEPKVKPSEWETGKPGGLVPKGILTEWERQEMRTTGVKVRLNPSKKNWHDPGRRPRHA